MIRSADTCRGIVGPHLLLPFLVLCLGLFLPHPVGSIKFHVQSYDSTSRRLTANALAVITALQPLAPLKHSRVIQIHIHFRYRGYLEAGGPIGTQGYFDPSTSEIHVLSLRGPTATTITLAHEMVHGYLEGFDLPIWLEEGLAIYYSEQAVSPGWSSKSRARLALRALSQDGRRITQLQALTASQFYGDEFPTNYALAWATVLALHHMPTDWKPTLKTFLQLESRPKPLLDNESTAAVVSWLTYRLSR